MYRQYGIIRLVNIYWKLICCFSMVNVCGMIVLLVMVIISSVELVLVKWFRFWMVSGKIVGYIIVLVKLSVVMKFIDIQLWVSSVLVQNIMFSMVEMFRQCDCEIRCGISVKLIRQFISIVFRVIEVNILVWFSGRLKLWLQVLIVLLVIIFMLIYMNRYNIFSYRCGNWKMLVCLVMLVVCVGVVLVLVVFSFGSGENSIFIVSIISSLVIVMYGSWILVVKLLSSIVLVVVLVIFICVFRLLILCSIRVLISIGVSMLVILLQMFIRVMCCVVVLIGLRMLMYGLMVVCSRVRLLLMMNRLLSVLGYQCCCVQWVNIIVLVVIISRFRLRFFFILVCLRIYDVGSVRKKQDRQNIISIRNVLILFSLKVSLMKVISGLLSQVKKLIRKNSMLMIRIEVIMLECVEVVGIVDIWKVFVLMVCRVVLDEWLGIMLLYLFDVFVVFVNNLLWFCVVIWLCCICVNCCVVFVVLVCSVGFQCVCENMMVVW